MATFKMDASTPLSMTTFKEMSSWAESKGGMTGNETVGLNKDASTSLSMKIEKVGVVGALESWKVGMLEGYIER
jgi:hypothetical protein